MVGTGGDASSPGRDEVSWGTVGGWKADGDFSSVKWGVENSDIAVELSELMALAML